MKKYLMTLLMLGLACNAAACMEDEPFYDTEIPPHVSIDNSKGEGVTRLVTYNVGIFNKYIKDDYQLIADMMKEIDADAICMNELDNNTNRTRHVYQLKHFASLMGSWDFEYGAAMPYDGGEYGEGVTTRKKAVNKFSVALPKGVGAEPRVLVVMEMEDYVICTSHLDHVSSEAQLGQVELITKTMKERYGDSGKPVFLGGDMNATPSSETGKLLQKDWEILTITGFGTFPSDNPSKCIDYIMQLKGTPKCEVVGSQILRWFKSGDVTKASDHLPVMLDIKLPAKNTTMKRYASIRLVAAAALLIASGGCKDDNPGTGLNGPAVLAIQNAGAEPLQISLLEPKTQTIDIRAVARSVSAENLTVTFKVDRTLVDAYNKAHDTSYELVPAEAYEFSKKEVILPRYNEVSSTAQVTLNSEKMPDGEQYLLPITIEQIKGDDAAQTSDEGNVYYILFNKRVLPPAQLLDREGWKVVHCTSEYTPGEGNPKTGWAKDVLDGNPASYWTYNFKASVGPVVYVPLYFVFDMGKEVTVRGVRITARTKAGGVLNNPPGDITIETAKTITGDGMENDADWTYSERFTGTKPDEGIMSHSLHNSVYLGEIQRARYIRFTLHMSWNSGSSVKPTPMTYKGGTFAEFEVWGNLEELDLD